MKKIDIKKLQRVEAPIGEYENIIAFQLVEFSINFFGHEETFILDTKITKEGQFVIDGNGWIKDGYQVI